MKSMLFTLSKLETFLFKISAFFGNENARHRLEKMFSKHIQPNTYTSLNHELLKVNSIKVNNKRNV
jgi:hypothetical protein